MNSLNEDDAAVALRPSNRIQFLGTALYETVVSVQPIFRLCIQTKEYENDANGNFSQQLSDQPDAK